MSRPRRCDATTGPRMEPLEERLLLSTFYIDFDGGSDAATGRSPTAAFKHCPGDASATGTALATLLAGGDKVIFKGGVHYRGQIVGKWSGVSGAPITYDGNTAGDYGAGPAILDGSQNLTGWVQSQSAADAGGNPNWQHIWYAYAPSGTTAVTSNLYDEGRFCWLSQDVDLPDPFLMDDISQFYQAPPSAVTTTSLIDPTHLISTDPNYYNGAWVMVWVQPNVVDYRAITSYSPSQHKITYAATGNPYTDRNTCYSIYNSLSLISVPGEYYFNDTPEANGTHKVYLWPIYGGDPNAHPVTVSVRGVALDLSNGRDYITVQGLHIERYTGSALTDGIGIKVLAQSGNSSNGIQVLNNAFEGIRHGGDRGYGAVYFSNVTNSLIQGNTVTDMPVNMGFLIGGGTNVTVQGNVVRHVGAQGIWFMGVTNGQIIENEVYDSRGTHANGISVYLNSSNVLVARNKVFDSNISITIEESTNVTVAYNLCINPTFYVIADWGGMTGLKIHNNTTIRDEDLPSITTSSTGVEVKNNLGLNYASSGSLTPDANKNIFFKHSQWGSLFVNPAARDFRLKAGSPAIDAGSNLGYTEDVQGTPVPTAPAPEIGAYETRKGDFNVDWQVGAADIDLLYAAIRAGSTAAKYDLSGGGGVNQADVDFLVHGILNSEYGDANLDGQVDAADQGALSRYWRVAGAGWARGDFTGDGSVGAADLAVLRRCWHWQRPAGFGAEALPAAADSQPLLTPSATAESPVAVEGAAPPIVNAPLAAFFGQQPPAAMPQLAPAPAEWAISLPALAPTFGPGASRSVIPAVTRASVGVARLQYVLARGTGMGPTSPRSAEADPALALFLVLDDILPPLLPSFARRGLQ